MVAFQKLWLFVLCLGQVAFVACQNFYDSDAHIIELSERNFDNVIHKTNYTTLVEFYAPWCGYCKQLKSTIQQVGKKLDGVAQIAAVNCDLDKNKQLCSEHGVKGFPTLMVFRPPKVVQKNNKKHASETYQGERKAKSVIDFVASRVKNHVKKLRSIDTIGSIMQKANTNKSIVILFSKKETVSTMYKTLAIDWLGQLSFFIIHNNKLKLVSSEFESKFPTIWKSLVEITESQKKNSDTTKLVVLHPESDKIDIYDGKTMTKIAISKFLSNITDSLPKEGPLSKRHEYLESVKSAKKSKTKSKGRPKGKVNKKKSNSKQSRDEL